MDLHSEQATVRVDSDVSQEEIEEEFDDVTVMEYVKLDNGGRVNFYTHERRENLPDDYDWDDEKSKVYRIIVDGNEILYMSEDNQIMPPFFVENSDYLARVSRDDNMVIYSEGEDVYSAFDKISHVFGDMEVITKDTCVKVEEPVHNLDKSVRSVIDGETFGLTEEECDVEIFLDSPYRLVVRPYDEVTDGDKVMENYEDVITHLVENEVLRVDLYKYAVSVNGMDDILESVDFDKESTVENSNVLIKDWNGGMVYVLPDENIVVGGSEEGFNESMSLLDSFLEDFDGVEIEKEIGDSVNIEYLEK
jgi:hypothetical protein